MDYKDVTREEIVDWEIYEETRPPVKLVKMGYPFFITKGGVKYGDKGDWLAEDEHRNRYPVKNGVVKSRYKKIELVEVTQGDPALD